MEEPSSIENQMAMAPVVGNMAHLCLLCAEARSPEEEPFIEIYGELGKQLNISEKIHKFLTIAIVAGFPLQVCVACVGKLNVCHELVQSSEKAHEKFKSLRDEWDASQVAGTLNEPLDDMEDATSQMDVDVPSPEVDFTTECQELKTEQQPTEKIKKKSMEDIVQENQLEEFSMLQQQSCLKKGSQVSVFVVNEVANVKSQYRLSLVLLNADENNSKKNTKEKINRVTQLVKKGFETDATTSSNPLHSCQSCKCSFFLQEEMVSHFESLHPEEVLQCTVCDEKICGPVQMQEKHVDLHRALEEGQIDELLTTLQVPSVSNTNMFDPEFVVVPLGELPPSLKPKSATIFQFVKCIQRHKWIKPDMKGKLPQSLKIFIRNIKLYVQPPKIKQKFVCGLCGQKESTRRTLERHMRSKHKPDNTKCCHCSETYLSRNENSHIESRHNGGEYLVCRICDSKFSASGEDQPHMIPKSDFPFKCSTKSCRKVYRTEARLEKHIQTIHIPNPNMPPCLCELCGKVYKNKRCLRHHLADVHFPNKNAVYICELCGITYSKIRNLRSHKLRVHEPKVSCDVCGKSYNSKDLIQHMRIHKNERKFHCKYCGKSFVKRMTCKLHEEAVHEGVKRGCRICKGLYFKSAKALEAHMLKHEYGEEIILPKYLQPVQCPICSQTIKTFKLSAHMRRHKRSGNNGILSRWKLKNAENGGVWTWKERERTFPCHPCLIRFMTQECHDKHVETCHPDGVPNASSVPNTKEFRYQCRYCDKTFKRILSCNDHESLHGSGKQHACDFCGKRYTYHCDKWVHQKKKCTARPEVGGSCDRQ